MVKAVSRILFLGICLFIFACAGTQKEPKLDKENDPQYLYDKAVVSMNFDLIDEAIRYLKQSLELDPFRFSSHYLLGVAYVKKENWEEAVKSFEESVKINPDNPDPHAYLASLYQRLGLNEKAIEEHKKIDALDKNFKSSFTLANYYFQRNELDKALEFINQAVILDRESASAHNVRGAILSKLGRYQEAILSFQNALRLDSTYTIAGINLGVAYINTKQFDRAREVLTDVLAITDDPVLKTQIQKYLDAIKKILLPSVEVDIVFDSLRII